MIAEAKRRSSTTVIDASWHPLASGSSPSWASGWGEDNHGIFVEFTYRDITQCLRWCPPGRFWMGSPEDENGWPDNENPQKEITFPAGFWIFDTVVTQALYQAVMGTNPSQFREAGADHPVEEVSWKDARMFLDKLHLEIPGLPLSLPSEAQWEYACRAGSTTPFEPMVASCHKGLGVTEGEVNCRPMGRISAGVSRDRTVPVKGAGFRPNAWGLWHMHGNVWEWCADVWHNDHEGVNAYGKPRMVSKRSEPLYVIRGGSWSEVISDCRAAIRNWAAPNDKGVSLGFRPVSNQPTNFRQPSGSSVSNTTEGQ